MRGLNLNNFMGLITEEMNAKGGSKVGSFTKTIIFPSSSHAFRKQGQRKQEYVLLELECSHCGPKILVYTRIWLYKHGMGDKKTLKLHVKRQLHNGLYRQYCEYLSKTQVRLRAAHKT